MSTQASGGASPPTQPTTLTEFRAAMAAIGRSPIGFGYWNEPEVRSDEGSIVLTQLADGTWEIAVCGYYGKRHQRIFADEATAVADLARSYLQPLPTVGPSHRELDRVRRRMWGQALLDDTLDQLRRPVAWLRGKGGDHRG